jgi:integrase
MKTQRREISVKHNPGIAKIQEWNEEKQKWIDSGKYRATRRVSLGGMKSRESGFFNNIEDAKRYRLGKLEKAETGAHHKSSPVVADERMRFSQLVSEWRDFHFEKVDRATKQTYERKLPPLEILNDVAVDDIDARCIDKLVKYWKSDAVPKGAQRHSFEKELDALKVILNYYRKRYDPRFAIQIYREHVIASRVKTVARQGVKSLKQSDLRKFFSALKGQKNEMYFPLALTQFGLSLRIGEVCALKWEDFDFEEMTVRIRRTIVWDHDSHAPRFKDCPKNGKERMLAIPQILATELLKLKKQVGEGKLVFHQNGEPFIRMSVGVAYNRALDESGITYVRGTHLLRKTSATQANMMTGDYFAVSQNLGHSSVEETKRYVEEVDEGKRKVARALNDVALAVLLEEPAHDPQRPAPGGPRKLTLVKS